MMTLERFDDINHLPLKVFNRVMFVNNLIENGGPDASLKYFEMFDQGEKIQMAIITELIKNKGVEYVRKLATNGLEIVENEET